MEENAQAALIGTWRRLGARTYWLFLSQKIEVAATFLILALVFTYIRSASFLPKEVLPFVGLAGVVCFVVFFAALAYGLLSAWFQYKSHEYCLAEDALKIRQGIVTKQEIAIPYRQIQNVDIERSLSNQIFGLSKVIVLTAGHDDEKTPDEDESTGVMPAMDKALASELQEELLRRADVQRVVQAKI